MNKTVDFLSKQYDDFISQLQLINTRNAQQSVKNSSAKLRSNQRTPVTKQKSLHNTLGVTVWKHRASHPVRAIQATTLFVGSENLMAYKSQMAIFLLPILYLPSIPMLCQRLLSSLFEEMFAISFTQIAESLWRRKRVCNLPDLDLEVDSNVYISELLTSTRKKLFGDIQLTRKRSATSGLKTVASSSRKPMQGEASVSTAMKISLNSEAAFVASLYTLFPVIKPALFALYICS